MRSLLGMGALALALPLAASAAEPVQRYALLVGHNQGGGDRATLRYAHTDAQALHGVLTGLGGVDTGSAELLLSGNNRWEKRAPMAAAPACGRFGCAAHFACADQENIVRQSARFAIFNKCRHGMVKWFDDQLLPFRHGYVIRVRMKVPYELRVNRNETTAGLA